MRNVFFHVFLLISTVCTATQLLCLKHKYDSMAFSLNDLNAMVSQAAHPEMLRDLLVHIFHEVAMRANGNQTEQTGFEEATEEELELAFIHMANELLVRWGRLQDQLGNFVVGTCDSVY